MKELLIVWDFNGVINQFGEKMAASLLQLQAHGSEQIIASSSMVGTIEQYLKKYELDGYFSQIYGYAPTTLQWVGDSATMKEDLVHHHLRKFGPYDRVVVIGDSESDVRAGKSNGCETFLYSDGVPPFETTADHIVHSLDEIVALLIPEKGKGSQ